MCMHVYIYTYIPFRKYQVFKGVILLPRSALFFQFLVVFTIGFTGFD